MSEQNYKTFRVNINTTTLLDDFAPVLIDDISDKFRPIFLLKQDYCSQLRENCNHLETFPEFSNLTSDIYKHIKELENYFSDCEENINYFTLVFMGAVSAGKTSMICDFLNVNPDRLNEALQTSKDFQHDGSDDVVIAGEVATANVYEFLVDSSRIRLVDVPGTGGVVHDNTTLAPFVNKADCVIFLSNALSDLTRSDLDFVVRHIVGLKDISELTSENASDKKALIVVNKWKAAVRDLSPHTEEKQWLRKKDWILWGDSKKEKGGKFPGLSNLFRRTLVIVRANTSKRMLDEDTKSYERYGEKEIQLNEVIDALKEILLEEGIQIKLERPKIILKDSLSEVQDILDNEKIKCSVDDLVEKLKEMGLKVTIDSSKIMWELNSRLDSLRNRLKNDLYYQIKIGFDQWEPNVTVAERIKGIWPKEWWGSDKFGAKALQNELKDRWKTEIGDLLHESIKPDDIKRTVSDEADSISKLLEATFKVQLAQLQNEVLKDKLSRGISVQSLDDSSFSLTGSNKTLENAVSKATSEIQHSIVDDVIGIITTDAILAALLSAILSPLGSVLFFAIRRSISGQEEEKKAKRNIEDEILRIADEVSGELQEKVASKLRGSVQSAVDSIAALIKGEQESLSKSLQALDEAISTVNKIRRHLESI
ncbi:hypothetical protein [Okeania sp. KiyG1]|uniref:hypothetical protein n=1 Tax=Okeania sp. KiyG1 TaxID=2720165 RepID=UPI001924A48C|nr:hypothetical protein [Okeania sp. KiyG1]GFZ90772.1 hypothetical protein CYANOKiyG1_01110 [Okeania sp. KiyG1]